MGLLPASYYARCTHTGCTWNVETNERKYRDHLQKQHERRYSDHVVQTTDYP